MFFRVCYPRTRKLVSLRIIRSIKHMFAHSKESKYSAHDKILTCNRLNQTKTIYIDVETAVMTVPESPYSGCVQSSPTATVPRVPLW